MYVVLGLIGLVFYIVCVVTLAASVTWTVVRFSPKPKKEEPAQPAA